MSRGRDDALGGLSSVPDTSRTPTMGGAEGNRVTTVSFSSLTRMSPQTPFASLELVCRNPACRPGLFPDCVLNPRAEACHLAPAPGHLPLPARLLP